MPDFSMINAIYHLRDKKLENLIRHSEIYISTLSFEIKMTWRRKKEDTFVVFCY